MINKRLRNFPETYIAAVLVVIFFSLVGAYLEYNYFLLDGLPFREVKPPTIGFLYNYDLIFFIPITIMFAFAPIIYQLLTKHSFIDQSLKRPLALGIGTTMLGLILKDAGWFLIRVTAPLLTDPLAHQWIRPSDYTASFIGSAQILGLTLPLWYLALVPPIVALLISLVITEPDLEKHFLNFA